MANYYVSLSATSNGTGTNLSPFTWLQFYADVSGTTGTIANGDTIYLRGSKDITNSPTGTKSLKTDENFQIKMLAWDLSTYGPWRIYDSLNKIYLNGVVEIQGGIIISEKNRTLDENTYRIPSLTLYVSAVDNCFLKSERISLRSFPESSANPETANNYGYCICPYCGDIGRMINFRGSSVISEDYNFGNILEVDLREPTKISFKDCVVYVTNQSLLIGKSISKTPSSSISAEYDWTVLNAPNIASMKTTVTATSASSNMQYEWTVPINWPTYSADKENFSFSILGRGITISGSNNW